MQASWNTLLELARQGDVARLTALVAVRRKELHAQRPQPEAGEPYGRRLIYQSDLGEVMLAGWRRDACSAPHDHGDAKGFVIVLDGRLIETKYAFDGRFLRVADKRQLHASSCTAVSPGDVHDMRSVDAGLTLHLYVPAIQAMHVYDPEERTTLLVPGNSGAWLPRRGAFIRERLTWDSAAFTSATR